MIPYFLFLLFLFIFYWGNKPVCMLIVMIAFAVLRYDTGWDYGMYEHIVSTPSYWDNADTSRFSLVWRGLFALSNKLNTPHLAIAVANVLTYVVLYISLCVLKLTKTQKLHALLVYCLWNDFYLSSFSTIRQALSMTIGLLVFAFIQRKKLLISILSYLIAVHVHSSAVILILLYPIYFLRRQLNFKWLCISVILIGIVLACIESVLTSLTDVGLNKYEIYLKWQDSFGSKLIYLNVMLALYFMVVFYKNKHISEMERQCYFMVLSGIFGGIAIYVYGGSIVFTRMLSYFTIFMIFILFPSINVFKERVKIRLLLNCILVIFFITYLGIISKGGGSTLSPYVPYKCIFLKE